MAPGLNKNENYDIAIAMSSSRADPVLPWLGVLKCLILTTNERVGLSLHWLEVFKYLIQ